MNDVKSDFVCSVLRTLGCACGDGVYWVDHGGEWG
jgi:hypothetical protein